MQYANSNTEDSFLQQLAEGGFQVGELAKDYYPNGILIDERQHEKAAEQTLALLTNENITLYEAAFLWNNCYVLVDILVKTGNSIELMEVKAKSYDGDNDSFFQRTDNNKLNASWQPYLYDVAFQHYVVTQSLEQHNLPIRVTPYLLLANKKSYATVDGLNQLYQLTSVDGETGRKRVQKNADATKYIQPNLGTEILLRQSVENEVKNIYDFGTVGKYSFKEGIIHYSKALTALADNDLFTGRTSKATCKKCEFSGVNANGKTGVQECLERYKNLKETDFKKPFGWDIWNFRGFDKCLADGKFLMESFTREDLTPKSGEKTPEIGMSSLDRQDVQRELALSGSKSPYVLREQLALEIGTWKFPLHFIDFEGTRTALPFYKNMRPYQQVAFQFSHHIVHQNGRIEHATEWINMEPGFYPNFAFIRALYKALKNDDGTIFKYSHYENTVLTAIKLELEQSKEPDAEELIHFIKTITNYTEGKQKISGDRDMVDLCTVVKKYYYNPLTNGSNSIKYVLPAVLNTNTQLQEKYSQRIYGTTAMPSKNFKNLAWVQKDVETGLVKDPYKLLKNIYDGVLDICANDDENEYGEQVANGGAAMAAYNEIQFAATTEERKQELKAQLLKYCELDTLAMVMVYEELVQQAK